MQQRCAFCVAEQKEISDGKARCLIPCITCWKCNLFSLSSCHEFCRRFATQPGTRLTRTRTGRRSLSLHRAFARVRTSAWKSVWRRAHSRFIHVLSYTNPHTYTVHFAQPLARGAIRKLYSKRLAFNPPGKLDAGRARWNVGLHVTGARFRC